MTVIDVCPLCDGDMEPGQVCRTCYPPTIPELRCAAPDCTREWPAFQVWTKPLEATARTYGWIITDDGRAYCPPCADRGAARILAAVDGCDHADSLYGRCVACGMTWQQQAVARG